MNQEPHKRHILIWLLPVLAIVIIFRFAPHLWQWKFTIAANNMEPVLKPGDTVLVNRRAYHSTKPSIGDIIIFQFPSRDKGNRYFGKPFVSRICAIGGDSVEIKNKRIFVNGVQQEDQDAIYLDSESVPKRSHIPGQFQWLWETGQFFELTSNESNRDYFGPVRVPFGGVFALGDNRDRSYDSRFWGPVPESYIIGRVVKIISPKERRRDIK